jgi:hypothetical protein
VSTNKPRRTARKGRAAYYEPRDSNLLLNNWRAFFLETVKKFEPKVLEDLSREPLRLFLNSGLGDPNIDARQFFDIWRRLKSESWHRFRDVRGPVLWFRQKLWEWGDRWKLNEEWCLDAAFHTLSDWAHDPESVSELSWSLMIYAGGYVITPIPSEDKFSFEHYGWELTKYPTREKFEELIRAAFEKALKAYCDRIEEEAPKYGYVIVPPPKFARKPHLPFEWLVRFKVQGWTLYKINKEYHPNSSADNRARIKEGINYAAALVGFQPCKFSP